MGTYERPERFTPLFDTPGTLDDFVWTRLPDAGTNEPLAFERISIPTRSIVPDDVRPLLAATELRESCKLSYQSMTTSESTERLLDGCDRALPESAAISGVNNSIARYTSAGLLTDFLYRVRRDNPEILRGFGSTLSVDLHTGEFGGDMFYIFHPN